MSAAPKPRPATSRKRPRTPKTPAAPAVTCAAVSIATAAQRLECSPKTVRRLLKTGAITPYARVAADIRIPVDAIDRYLSANLVTRD
jgi:excisionase family DNA binding protein